MEKETRQIKKIVSELLSKMTFESEISVKTDGSVFYVNIETEEPSFLIGKGGETLKALEYLLRQMINKKAGELLYTVVDVAEYRAKKKNIIIQIAERYIESAKKTGRAQVLPIMNSFERHIVHSLISEEKGLESESIGEEPNRRVVIRKVGEKVGAKK